jgi:Na+/melibiose symporter-like transporter
MIIVWVCTSLTFYMFNFFIKYMPGDIYFNSIVSSFSVGALILQTWLAQTIGPKRSIMFTFIVTAFSSLLLCLFDKSTSHLITYALVLMIAKGGATLNFGFAYAIH